MHRLRNGGDGEDEEDGSEDGERNERVAAELPLERLERHADGDAEDAVENDGDGHRRRPVLLREDLGGDYDRKRTEAEVEENVVDDDAGAADGDRPTVLRLQAERDGEEDEGGYHRRRCGEQQRAPADAVEKDDRDGAGDERAGVRAEHGVAGLVHRQAGVGEDSARVVVDGGGTAQLLGRLVSERKTEKQRRRIQYERL